MPSKLGKKMRNTRIFDAIQQFKVTKRYFSSRKDFFKFCQNPRIFAGLQAFSASNFHGCNRKNVPFRLSYIYKI
jgi:hypothetical protein